MKTRLIPSLILSAVFCTSAHLAWAEITHDQHPVKISTPAPAYPFESRRDVDAAVLASFDITTQGDVTNIVILSSTDQAFERPTVLALNKWKFTPATLKGVPVTMPAVKLFVFKVNGKEQPTTVAELLKNLKPRLVTMTGEKVASTDACFCGSGKLYNECHGLSADALYVPIKPGQQGKLASIP